MLLYTLFISLCSNREQSSLLKDAFTSYNFRFLYYVKVLTHANLKSFSFVNNYEKWRRASCALFDATSYFYFHANKAACIQTLHRRMLMCQNLDYKYAPRLRKSVSVSLH